MLLPLNPFHSRSHSIILYTQHNTFHHLSLCIAAAAAVTANEKILWPPIVFPVKIKRAAMHNGGVNVINMCTNESANSMQQVYYIWNYRRNPMKKFLCYVYMLWFDCHSQSVFAYVVLFKPTTLLPSLTSHY